MNHFLRGTGAHLSGRVTSFAPAAMDLMIHAPWPGNVRQLQNVVQRTAALSTTPVIAEALARIDRFAGEFAPTSQPAAKAVEMRAYYSEAHVRRRAGALDAFLRYTAELDAARGESFRTAFPELAERLDQDQARHRTQHPVPAPSGGIRLAEAG